MARHFCLAIFISSISLLVAGCSGPGLLESRFEYASRLAADSNWRALRLDAGAFVIQAFTSPPTNNTDHLTIYFEGDGNAWRDRFTPGRDPTPRHPVGLRLALLDPGPAAYLARPCQYTRAADRRNCYSRFWTSARFSPHIVKATDFAVEHLKQRSGAKRLTLIGYSGGGVLAALVASRRSDVDHLITLASPMSISSWVTLHDISPLTLSLTPMDGLNDLATLRQTHFVGANDDIVPPIIVQDWIRALPANAPARVFVVADTGHGNDWLQRWPDILPRLDRHGTVAPKKPDTDRRASAILASRTNR